MLTAPTMATAVGVLLLAACGAGTDVATSADHSGPGASKTPSNETSDAEAEAEPPPVLPEAAPRWLAVATGGTELSVVRFDDAERPETFLLASGDETLVSEGWVWWSPQGTHVAFLTCDAVTWTASLFIASAMDDFDPRPVGASVQIERSGYAL